MRTRTNSYVTSVSCMETRNVNYQFGGHGADWMDPLLVERQFYGCGGQWAA